ncbi:MAG: hypothetical protein AB1599_08400 [Planctomycetota bacterium]
MLNKDYKEMLQCLLSRRVRFLVVGAYAMGAHGYPRATGDLDIWVEPSPENSAKVYQTLLDFKAHLAEIDQKTFARPGVIFQIGLAPRRIDIITKIDGVDFKKAYPKRKSVDVENLKIPFLSKADLIKNKSSTGRDKDNLDVRYLKQRQS